MVDLPATRLGEDVEKGDWGKDVARGVYYRKGERQRRKSFL